MNVMIRQDAAGLWYAYLFTPEAEFGIWSSEARRVESGTLGGLMHQIDALIENAYEERS